jgi:hypothetical protein
MNDARDEFRLLRTTVEDALYLDENCLSPSGPDVIMETSAVVALCVIVFPFAL